MKKMIQNRPKIILIPGIILLGFFSLLSGCRTVGTVPHREQPALAELLARLHQYRQGQNDDLVVKLDAYIRSQRSDSQKSRECEKALIDFLSSQPTLDGTMIACRHLRVIGSELSLGILEKMLLDPKTNDPARYALEKIPGSAADEVMLRALNQGQGKIRLGIISSIGHRKIGRAVPLLNKYLTDSDSSTAEAAAAALGLIGTQEAAESLSQALHQALPPEKLLIGRSLLQGTESGYFSESPASAEKYYDQILNEDLPSSQKNAALRAKIKMNPEKGRELIREIIQNNESMFLGTAIDMIPRCFSDSELTPLLSFFDNLEPEYQIRLLSALSHFKTGVVCELTTTALQNSDASVRIAALETLLQIGNASHVGIIVPHISQSKGIEQEAARRCLWELKDNNVDKVILENIRKETLPQHLMEYLSAVRERRISQGRIPVLELTRNQDSSIRYQALRTLREIALPEDVPAMISLLQNSPSEREINEIILIMTAAVRRKTPQSPQINIISKHLSTAADVPTRAALIRVLGKLGDDSSLPLLRSFQTAADPVIWDAYVRALSEWPNPVPSDDLFKIASRTENLAHHTLALRAFIRMIEIDRNRQPQAAVLRLKKALEISRRKEEKWAVLGVLPRFACMEALQLAESLINEEGLEKEAQIAAERIRKALGIQK